MTWREFMIQCFKTYGIPEVAIHEHPWIKDWMEHNKEHLQHDPMCERWHWID